ncbi:MAG: hypothetical protein HRT44_01425 [Bdellovibrionales bacterium]|nr:hypothetical protein [Bdellovibrionales bacterium]NQZ17907.1 hypothetical protein [Bdellovibrionales bacterium]
MNIVNELLVAIEELPKVITPGEKKKNKDLKEKQVSIFQQIKRIKKLKRSLPK